MSQSRRTGKVKWFNSKKGYGFIEQTDDASDIFVHFSSILGNGYRTLDKNQPVEYEITLGPKGKYAERVILIKT